MVPKRDHLLSTCSEELQKYGEWCLQFYKQQLGPKLEEAPLRKLCLVQDVYYIMKNYSCYQVHQQKYVPRFTVLPLHQQTLYTTPSTKERPLIQNYLVRIAVMHAGRKASTNAQPLPWPLKETWHLGKRERERMTGPQIQLACIYPEQGSG